MEERAHAGLRRDDSGSSCLPTEIWTERYRPFILLSGLVCRRLPPPLNFWLKDSREDGASSQRQMYKHKHLLLQQSECRWTLNRCMSDRVHLCKCMLTFLLSSEGAWHRTAARHRSDTVTCESDESQHSLSCLFCQSLSGLFTAEMSLTHVTYSLYQDNLKYVSGEIQVWIRH